MPLNFISTQLHCFHSYECIVFFLQSIFSAPIRAVLIHMGATNFSAVVFKSTHSCRSHSYGCHYFFRSRFLKHPSALFSPIWVHYFFLQSIFSAPIHAVLIHMGATIFSAVVFKSTHLRCSRSYGCIIFFSNQFSVHPFVPFSFIWVPLFFPQSFFEAPIRAFSLTRVH